MTKEAKELVENMYDEDGDLIDPRPARKGRPMNTTMFRLRDPATGLFWVHSSAKNPEFGQNGKHWANIKSAMKNWSEYNLQGILKADTRPSLELVKFKMEVTELGVQPETGPDMQIMAGLKLKFKRDDTLYMFARGMTDDKFPFKYIMYFELHEETVIPTHIKCKTRLVSMRNSWSMVGNFTPHPDILYVGVTSEVDLIYLKMAFSEQLAYHIDIAKMEKIGNRIVSDPNG